MRSTVLFAAGVSVLLLTACETTPPADEASTMCNADAGQSFVGKTADEATVEQARKATGSKTVRVTLPNQPVTMDYRPDRLNIGTDEAKVILKVSCG
ncbi:hypothetical protein ACFB49_13830 [Sphingomonas sp. DBB INV C78]|uniref:I78 family peptidase inhibitor n=1 Tax=Sphingomonas sp. DBB INV C78 TaxID=3349434 RepID=UPI0036D2C8D4